MTYGTDSLSNSEFLIIIAIIIGLLLLFAFFIYSFVPFKEERDCIKMEMARALDEHEYLYWKKKLNMLYISKIPVLRSIAERRKYKR